MPRLAALLGALALASAAGGAAASGTTPGAAADVRLLGRQLEELHPNVFDEIPRARFRAAVERAARRAPGLDANELLVELMRVAALPGARNGHTGIFPGDPRHRRQLHLYPLRLYTFPEGTFVVGATGAGGLVGARVVAVAGMPFERVLELVAPLVPRDNVSSLRGLAPHYALTAEVLDGLGVVEGAGQATFTFERSGGERFDARLAPLEASAYVSAFADPHHGHYPASLPKAGRPLYLARSDSPLWITTLERGRTVVVGYNSALAATYEVSRRLEQLGRRPGVERVVVDVRLNGGGDNTTYGPLLGVLRDPRIDRKGRLFLLVGRATFSAAGNFAAEVDATTRATLVGEPTGGGVNQYGDSTTFSLPATGWNVYVATSYQQFGRRGDPRLTIRPDVPVALTAADYFAGRDPVLAAVLAR